MLILCVGLSTAACYGGHRSEDDAGEGADADIGTPCTDPVTFTDPVLESAVRGEIGVASGPIRAADLARLTALTHDVAVAGGDPIRDLDGLECATNLRVLSLTGAYVGAGVVDGVTDASALSRLGSLRELTLVYASLPLEELSGLSGLTLLKLEYSTPGTISTPGSLDALALLVNLTSLDASDGCVADISAVAGMTLLQSLDLYSNCVDDISALEDLTGVTRVDLTDNFLDCADAGTLAVIATLEARGATVLHDCR